jgi:hypothetical protein
MDKTDDQLLQALERALAVAETQLQGKQREIETAEGRVEALRRQVRELRGDLHLGGDSGEEYVQPAGSMTDGIRLYLQERGKAGEPLERTATAKDVESWLIRKGYRTGARNFYWSVYGALRAMQQVVGLVREGETTRFAWRDAMTKPPAGWRLVNFPRRTTLASRQRAEETTKPKVKARGAK